MGRVTQSTAKWVGSTGSIPLFGWMIIKLKHKYKPICDKSSYVFSTKLSKLKLLLTVIVKKYKL